MRRAGLSRRASRAIERQLAYQRIKAERIAGHEAEVMAGMAQHAAAVRSRLEAFQPIPPQARVLEVGSGAHGLIFFFDAQEAVGVDPLADHYRALFPRWQQRARTIAVPGEALPFGDASFDVVLCDNVVDHAENPRKILEEIARVMAPGSILYFEVNVHHWIYHAAASVHAAWRSLGIPLEVGPFADHTYHFTRDAARGLFYGLGLRLAGESDTVAEEMRRQREAPIERPSHLLKRLFFKNAAYEVIALKPS